MTARESRFFIMTFALAFLFTPLGGMDGVSVPRVPDANGATLGFEDAKLRANAMEQVNAHTVPGGSCQSLINNKEAFQFTCDANMLPLDRQFCEDKFREIIAETTCRDPYAPSPAMAQEELCVALKGGFARMCGANRQAKHAEDCTRTQAAIDKNKCVLKFGSGSE